MKRLLWLGLVFVARQASAAGQCTPFDIDQGSVSNGRLPDGGLAPDSSICCKEGLYCEHKCPNCSQVSEPIDTLNGFAWLDRVDIHLSQPWGPAVRFARHYSTAAAERSAGPLALGWSHTYSSSLVLFGPSPAPRVWLYDGEDAGEEFNLAGGAYTSLRGGRSLMWDSQTQVYVADRGDGRKLVFDSNGKLRVLVSADGGEAQLRYAEPGSCSTTPSLPSGALCRVDFLFGRQLQFSYFPTGALETVTLVDGTQTGPVVTLAYDTEGLLTTATAADQHAETYSYAFSHSSWLNPAILVKLLTQATDADGKLVESFSYGFNHTSSDGPARVATHHTPEGDYTFTWEYLNPSTLQVVRKTHVRSNKENIDLTFANNMVVSACYLDSAGNCDVSRTHSYVPANNLLDVQCEREGSGRYRRYERDTQGRVVAVYEGLAECGTVTSESRARGEQYSYLGSTSLRTATIFTSLDPTAPSGFAAFRVADYTLPSSQSAINPYCGTSSCQTASAYNASPLTSRVQRHVTVGRTLADDSGAWMTQVRVESYGFDAQGRQTTSDGPRRDVSDITTYAWNSAKPWRLQSMAAPGRAPVQYSNYDVRGQAHTVVDEAGQTHALDFDSVGRLTSYQAPGQSSSTGWSYLPSGRLAAQTRPAGSVTNYGYDANGQLASETRLASAGSTQPDAVRAYARIAKRVTEVTDTDGQVRRVGYRYDSQGRRTTTLSPGPTRGSAVGIDDDERLTWRSDPGRFLSGAQTPTQSHRYSYDEYGNLNQVQQLVGTTWYVVATYTYDVRGNITTFTDSKGVTIRYQHDDFGQLVEVESPDLGLRRYVYDEAGNLVRERRGDGRIVEYSYDATNRLLSVVTLGAQETWAWDGTSVVTNCANGQPLPAPLGAGRLTRVTDSAGDWYFGYWPDGRLRYEGLVVAGASCAKTISWEYDAAGLLVAMQYPSGARVEYGYPPAGALLHDRPSFLDVVAGGTRTSIVTNIVWAHGEVVGYQTPAGEWRLSRNQDGTPSRADALRGGTREQSFGGFDGWGNPGTNQETISEWRDAGQRHVFASNDLPALTSAQGPGYEPQAYSYLVSGDRKTANGAPYCYETGTHRLALVGGQSRYTYTPEGRLQTKTTIEGDVNTWCYGARGDVESTVGPGGDISQIVTNFRRQRVAEMWPLNGLREDFRVDELSRLLVEAGTASLTAQYPRPTREYVWLGEHPVAVIESNETADGSVSQRGVTYLFSGQLGEVLVEATAGGNVLRQYEYAPFGGRAELAALPIKENAVPMPVFSTPFGFLGSASGATGARAVQLHLTDPDLRACNVTFRSVQDGGDDGYVGTYSSDGGSEFTEWLPTSGLTLQISGCSGGDAGAGFWTPTVGVLSEKGMFQSTPHSEATANPYPPGGQHFQLSLAEPSYLELGDVHLASCDRLEVRNSSGQTVWSWTPQVNPFTGVPDQKGYTTKLQGLVNVGIWGAGCNGTELQRGFMLTRVLSESPADAGPPVSIGLPGQKFRSDGTIDNWNRFYDPATGRYLSPEPLLLRPEYAVSMVQAGMQTPTYAYAANNPLRYVDPTGKYLTTSSAEVRHWMSLLRQDASIGEMVGRMMDDPDFELFIEPFGNEGATGTAPGPFGGVYIRIRMKNINSCERRQARGGLPTSFPVVLAHELGHTWAFYQEWLNPIAGEAGSVTGQRSNYDNESWLWALIFENSQRVPGYYRPYHNGPSVAQP